MTRSSHNVLFHEYNTQKPNDRQTGNTNTNNKSSSDIFVKIKTYLANWRVLMLIIWSIVLSFFAFGIMLSYKPNKTKTVHITTVNSNNDDDVHMTWPPNDDFEHENSPYSVKSNRSFNLNQGPCSMSSIAFMKNSNSSRILCYGYFITDKFALFPADCSLWRNYSISNLKVHSRSSQNLIDLINVREIGGNETSLVLVELSRPDDFVSEFLCLAETRIRSISLFGDLSLNSSSLQNASHCHNGDEDTFRFSNSMCLGVPDLLKSKLDKFGNGHRNRRVFLSFWVSASGKIFMSGVYVRANESVFDYFSYSTRYLSEIRGYLEVARSRQQVDG